MWRYTTDGWRDVSLMAEQNQPTQSPLETVHPVIWTALTLLGVLLLLVMASSEREVNKLLKRDTVVKHGKV
jgi:tryptophan-rich sensory protein